MRKKIVGVGLILLVAFLIIAVISDNPQSYATTYNAFDMLEGSGRNISYEGQNYTLSSFTSGAKVNLGDTLELTVLVKNINGVCATVFVEKSDGTPIFAYKTVTNYPATYFMIVGNSNLTYYGTMRDLPYNQSEEGSIYRIQLGFIQQDLVNGVWNNDGMNGQYLIMLKVYSNDVRLTYTALSFFFLIAGLVTTIIGFYLKQKSSATHQKAN